MPRQRGSPQNLKGAGKAGGAFPGNEHVTEPQTRSLAGRGGQRQEPPEWAWWKWGWRVGESRKVIITVGFSFFCSLKHI